MLGVGTFLAEGKGGTEVTDTPEVVPAKDREDPRNWSTLALALEALDEAKLGKVMFDTSNDPKLDVKDVRGVECAGRALVLFAGTSLV